METKNIDIYNLKDLIKQAKNSSASALEKILNLGFENNEVLNAIFEVAKNNEENTIIILMYLAGKGNKNAVEAIYALSSSYNRIAINALIILSKTMPECKKMLEKIIDKNIEKLFSNDASYNLIPIIGNLRDVAKSVKDEKSIDALINKLFSADYYCDDGVYLIESLGDIARETHDEKSIDALIKSLSFDNGTTEYTINELFNFLENKKVFDAITKFANNNFYNSKYATEKLIFYIKTKATVENRISGVVEKAINAIAEMVINTGSSYSKYALKKLATSDIQDLLIDLFISNGMLQNSEILWCFNEAIKKGNEKVLNQYIENVISADEDTIHDLVEITNSIEENAPEIKTILNLLQKRVTDGDDFAFDLLRIISAKIDDNKNKYVDDQKLQLVNVISEIIKEDNKSSSIIVFIIKQLYKLINYDFRYDYRQILDVLLSIKDFDNTEIKNELISTFESILEVMEDNSIYRNKILNRIKELKSEKKLIQIKKQNIKL